ncbi:MAG: PH domain-containing protein, partial [Draconibacterium sp.]|nr:PH domain-containing protein [Draconibacterium sp.]
MENFSNLIVTPENLPDIKPETFNLLDKKYRTILFIRIAIFLFFISGAFALFLILFDEKPAVEFIISVISAIVIIVVYLIIITIFGFPKKGYLVREKDISFQKGLIVFKSTSVPFNRIQHVEVNQGVLAKIFKLSSVKIFTAGGTASDLSITGLPVKVAQNLKVFLSEKISEH